MATVGNKELRNKAIPFEALPFDYFGTNLGWGAAFPQDWAQFNGTYFTRPYSADLTEARLTAAITAPPGSGFDLYLGIGDMDANANGTESYSWPEILRRHKLLTGQTAPFHANAGAQLFIDSLDLMRGIPKKSSPLYNADGFLLLFTLGIPPVSPAGFTVNKFQ